MSNKLSDDYAIALDALSASLKNSYSHLVTASMSLEELDYSKITINRLRAFYQAQDQTKGFLNKQVAQAGADFFVETILFSIKLFIEIHELNLEVYSERSIRICSKSIRPDISLWREDRLIAVIECKTQLGWLRHRWSSHIQDREQKIRSVCPEASVFWLVMTSCNWPGFGDDPRISQTLFCLLNEVWPTHLSEIFDASVIETPLERLLEQIRKCSSR